MKSKLFEGTFTAPKISLVVKDDNNKEIIALTAIGFHVNMLKRPFDMVAMVSLTEIILEDKTDPNSKNPYLIDSCGGKFGEISSGLKDMGHFISIEYKGTDKVTVSRNFG